ncbi:MAG: Uma2 family endonuclease [Kaiparowitsia implicata GSE-PSE-MK54-09C]|nr:Uma2 family endonuclease [Kaiparowitsia implicata GSE-PSE-MK54-09C]
MTVLTLNLGKALNLTDEQFAQLAAANPEVRLERAANGALVFMPPTGGTSGQRNLDLEGQIWSWNRTVQLGVAFDSSTGFKLPNGATRSPDVAWVRLDRWESLTRDQRRRFPPLCPDFVVELCSETDDLDDLRLKMQEYVANGVQLGWLIEPKTQLIEVYWANGTVDAVRSPTQLSADPVLPGFELDLQVIFAPD